MSVTLRCSRCDATVELTPLPEMPGYVSIAGVDGWSSPPLLCPTCSAGHLLQIDAIAELLKAGRIVGLDPREMTRLALEQLQREAPHE